MQAIDLPIRELLRDGEKRTLKFCRSKDAPDDLKESCQFQQLGSWMSGLIATGLLPFPTPKSYSGSVAELVEKLQRIKLSRFKVPGTPPHLDSHINCGMNHKENLNAIVSEHAKLSGNIIQQLRLRSLKSGAFSEELFRELRRMDEKDPGMEPTEALHRESIHFKRVTDVLFSERNR